MVDLHETHATLHHAAGEQAEPPHFGSLRAVHAVEFFGGVGFAG